MKISNRANVVEPSLARVLFNKAKKYNDVIDLTLGDPDFSTCETIQNAACMAIKEGKTHYSANAGLIEARIAVANNIQKCWNRSADPNSEILITVGGMEALFLSLSALIDPGDEVIIFAPYYVNYLQMVRFLGGVPVLVNAYDEHNGICINKDDFNGKISKKTVAMIINSPNNPTGGVFDCDTLKFLADTAKENDITVITDEVYRTLLYDGIEHKSILSYYNDTENFILIDSLSKEFSMTGWRIGYAYGDKKVIQSMVKLQENVAACAPLPSQYALIEAYTSFPKNDFRQKFEDRRDALFYGISKIEKLSCVKPSGTFYMFVNISRTGLSAMEFSEKLLETEQVAVIPGETYGKEYSDYIRIAFTKDVSILKRATEKIARFISNLTIKESV